ncbi:hypothetical protein BHM03_00031315 [Ensete ventricosum]|nr:hypothetical protein BHM03_00031315 [Ensete ventricosum]
MHNTSLRWPSKKVTLYRINFSDLKLVGWAKICSITLPPPPPPHPPQKDQEARLMCASSLPVDHSLLSLTILEGRRGEEGKRGRGGENGREKSGDDVEGEGREGKKRRDERVGGEGEGETGDERGAGGRTGSEGGEGEGWDAETTTEEG